MACSIIKVEGLSFQYPGAPSPIFDGIHLEVERGDFVAVIGNNGSGKSSLCKAWNGLIPHFYSGSFEGKVAVNGCNTLEKTVAELSKVIGYVGQDFERQLVKPTVYEELCFAPLNYGMPDYRERAAEVILQLNLSDIRDKHIGQLSVGQKHLVAIGSLLALNPEIVIVDEPSSQLDWESAEQVYARLQMLNRKLGKTIIVIEHHAEWITRYCNTVVCMEKGRLLWKKTVRDAWTNRNESQERSLPIPQVTRAAFEIVQYIPETKVPITLQEGVSFFQSLPIAFGPGEALPAGHQGKGNAVIALEHVQYACTADGRNKKDVIKDISFMAYEGERIAVIGKIGIGKSTLLKLIAGLLKPGSGNVTVMGTPIKACRVEELSRFSVYAAQNPEGMFIEDHIEKDMELFFARRGLQGKNRLVNDILDDFNLQDLRSKDGRLLSGGEQKRAALAIAASMQPYALLLDEPTASLDFESRSAMFGLLNKLGKYSRTIIAATHDMELAAEWATRILVIEDGELLADGTPHQIFSNHELLTKAGVKEPPIAALSRMLGMNPTALSVREFSQRATIISDNRRKAGAYG